MQLMILNSHATAITGRAADIGGQQECAFSGIQETLAWCRIHIAINLGLA